MTGSNMVYCRTTVQYNADVQTVTKSTLDMIYLRVIRGQSKSPYRKAEEFKIVTRNLHSLLHRDRDEASYVTALRAVYHVGSTITRDSLAAEILSFSVPPGWMFH